MAGSSMGTASVKQQQKTPQQMLAEIAPPIEPSVLSVISVSQAFEFILKLLKYRGELPVLDAGMTNQERVAYMKEMMRDYQVKAATRTAGFLQTMGLGRFSRHVAPAPMDSTFDSSMNSSEVPLGQRGSRPVRKQGIFGKIFKKRVAGSVDDEGMEVAQRFVKRFEDRSPMKNAKAAGSKDAPNLENTAQSSGTWMTWGHKG